MIDDMDLGYAEYHAGIAAESVATALETLLPAGPDDKKPPPDWPHWQLCHELQHAKLLLSSALGRLAER